MGRASILVAVVALGLAWPRSAAAQYSYRGFVDAGLTWYPREAPNDDTHLVGDVQARFEPSIEVRPWLSFLGSFEARVDTDDQVGTGGVYWDRTLQRPGVAVRTLTAALRRGPLSVDVGKQFVRWGTSDIISPTDYFT